MTKVGYLGTEVLLIDFDMTKGVSLENVPSWLDEVTSWLDQQADWDSTNIGAIIVVGTKSDYYDELLAGGRGSDGQPLKTLDGMYAMAAQIGAHAFVCTDCLRMQMKAQLPWTAKALQTPCQAKVKRT